MNIVVPMAGRGSRFSERGVRTPKPLIEVEGRPMVAWALESLGELLTAAGRVIFVVLKEHETEYGVSELLRSVAGASARIVIIDDVTEGQLCTVLAAADEIDPGDDLLVASCDTYIVSDLAGDIRDKPLNCRGVISVADMPGDRWSFARTDAGGRVIEVAEKERISDHASTGLYYFGDAGEFLDVARQMIRDKEKTRGEYYVIPVYQKYMERGWHVRISVAERMYDMGTPEALNDFLAGLRR